MQPTAVQLLSLNGGVGKKSLAHRLCQGSFAAEVDPTVEERECLLLIADGHQRALRVYDRVDFRWCEGGECCARRRSCSAGDCVDSFEPQA